MHYQYVAYHSTPENMARLALWKASRCHYVDAKVALVVTSTLKPRLRNGRSVGRWGHSKMATIFRVVPRKSDGTPLFRKLLESEGVFASPRSMADWAQQHGADYIPGEWKSIHNTWVGAWDKFLNDLPIPGPSL
jgi:hypothetical protein